MHRCFELARRGAGSVSPNPMVGAVLVRNDRIIGEGWHQQFGQAHAEVLCLESVRPEDRALIPYSTLYCSLEPCSHYGKTPPCADLIIREKIPAVIVANTDPNPLVSGKGLEKLRSAGISVVEGLLAAEGATLNRYFFTWIREKRPYVILKWAQSLDGYLGRKGERTIISGKGVQRLVHLWRYESDAILVGAETVKTDDPVLDTRFFLQKPLLRVLLDGRGTVSANARLLSDPMETLVFGPPISGLPENKQFQSKSETVAISEILDALALRNKAILFVEGGAQVLQQFISSGLWDEIRQITSPVLLGSGIVAPRVPEESFIADTYKLGVDAITHFIHSKPVTS